jgi:hypothetical protein
MTEHASEGFGVNQAIKLQGIDIVQVLNRLRGASHDATPG